MPGMVYRVIPKQVIPFVATKTLTLAKGVDVSNFREASIIVRVHQGTSLSGGGAPTITVKVFRDAPTNEDADDFVDDSTNLVSSSITIAGSDAGPQLKFSALAGQLPTFLRVVLEMGGTGSGQAIISADIVAKS